MKVVSSDVSGELGLIATDALEEIIKKIVYRNILRFLQLKSKIVWS